MNITYVPFWDLRVHDPRVHNDNWETAMGPDWQERIQTDLAAFVATIDYLERHGAKVTVIEMPRASLDDKLAFHSFYGQNLRKNLCFGRCEDSRLGPTARG